MRILRATMIGGSLVLAMAIAAPAARAGNYTFTNFDGPPDFTQGTTVNGINNLGQAVGFTTAANGAFNNFIRNTDASFTNITFADSAEAMANGVNSNGQVVGGLGQFAFFLTNGGNTVTDLPSVTSTTTSEVAFGINDRGAIVGQYSDSSTGTSPGFVYAKGAFTTLNPVANDSQVFAQGINNNGLVVGFYNTDGVHDHGFLYDTATQKYTLLADPTVSANLLFTQFLGINDNGNAVGYYQNTDGSQHGFLYNIAAGTYSYLDDPNAARTGFSITQITGINNSNEIAGFYVDANSGLQRGFVAMQSVPEPGSMALLGIGTLLAAGFLRRREKGRRVQP